jgi:hypothetical protein
VIVAGTIRGWCRIIWEDDDPGPVWLEIALLGYPQQDVPMRRVDGAWQVEVAPGPGWVRYAFLTHSGRRSDRHRGTVRDLSGRRFSFAVVPQSTASGPGVRSPE